MKRLSNQDRLGRLRAQLRHFEQSPDFGDKEAVDAIRQFLLLRIREAEGAMHMRPAVDLWQKDAAHLRVDSEAA